MRSSGFIALCLLLLTGSSAPAHAGEKFITIGTASELGVYYPAGGAICRLVKRGTKEHGIRCFVEATSGSVFNLKKLHEGQLDLAIVQTDWLYQAYKGKRGFEGAGSNDALRSVFSMHTEAFTVLARNGSGIETVRDLRRKRIGIGKDGSGMLATAEEFMKAEGWTKSSFAQLQELKPDELGKALCEGKLDAILMTTGHPNGSTQEATSKCSTHLVPVEGKEIDKLIENNPYYVHISLPGHMYPGSPKPVETFGVKATLVTSSHVSDDIVYQVVKAVFDNLDNFKTLHPVFATLDKTKMVSEGLIVPIHPGALKYYREAGLIK